MDVVLVAEFVVTVLAVFVAVFVAVEAAVEFCWPEALLAGMFKAGPLGPAPHPVNTRHVVAAIPSAIFFISFTPFCLRNI